MKKNVAEYMLGIEELSAKCREQGMIDSGLYDVYDVKRGLRDINGMGVVAGLTKISGIKSHEMIDAVWQASNSRRIRRIQSIACKRAHIAYKFCQGCYYESAEQRYDEYACKKCTDACML